jgi:hypothetical protein
VNRGFILSALTTKIQCNLLTITTVLTQFFIYLDTDSMLMNQKIITNIYKVNKSSVGKNILLQHLPYKTKTKLGRHILHSRDRLHKNNFRISGNGSQHFPVILNTVIGLLVPYTLGYLTS